MFTRGGLVLNTGYQNISAQKTLNTGTRDLTDIPIYCMFWIFRIFDLFYLRLTSGQRKKNYYTTENRINTRHCILWLEARPLSPIWMLWSFDLVWYCQCDDLFEEYQDWCMDYIFKNKVMNQKYACVSIRKDTSFN